MRAFNRCRSWFEDWFFCLSEQWQYRCRMGALPLAFALAVLVMWTIHHFSGITSGGDARELFVRVGIASYIACCAMLLFERKWPLQTLGLFGLLFAGAELKFRLLGRRGPQPVPEWERDLIQATFEVSSIAIIVSVVAFGIARSIRKRRIGERRATPHSDRRNDG